MLIFGIVILSERLMFDYSLIFWKGLIFGKSLIFDKINIR